MDVQMAGVEIKKFLFNDDFELIEDVAPVLEETSTDDTSEPALAEDGTELQGDVEEIEEPIEEAPPTFSEEDLDITRREGEQAGRDEALKDLEGSLQKKLADTMDALLKQFATIEKAFADDKEERNLNAVGVATVIVRKLFPALNMDTAIDEIDHMIHEAMERTAGEIKLNFFVAEELTGEVEAKLKEKIAGSGRSIEYQVIGNADTALGDCRIEWDGGGLVRDQAVLWQEIDEIIERNLGTVPQIPADEQAPSMTQNLSETREGTAEEGQVEADQSGVEASPSEDKEPENQTP